MRWSILALTTIAMACTRKGGNADSALLADTTLPPAVAPDSATASQPPASSNPSTSQPGSGTPSTSGQRPSPSQPPNDARPSIPTTGGRVAPAGGERDTARGVPGVEGSERFTRVSLETSSGAITRLGGEQAAAVGRLSGLDVWVSGTRDEKGVLMVERFAVRGADGRPARDGILVQSGTDYFLRLADGSRFDIPNPPAALREHVNDRVWVSGAAGSPPVSFGVIERRR